MSWLIFVADYGMSSVQVMYPVYFVVSQLLLAVFQLMSPVLRCYFTSF